MTDSPYRLPDRTPEPVADSPAYQRVRRDLAGLTCGQLQDLKVRYLGLVQLALTYPKPDAEGDGAA